MRVHAVPHPGQRLVLLVFEILVIQKVVEGYLIPILIDYIFKIIIIDRGCLSKNLVLTFLIYRENNIPFVLISLILSLCLNFFSTHSFLYPS